MALSVSEITIYFMRSVFISSKCPNLSGILREEPPHYTIKLVPIAEPSHILTPIFCFVSR